MYFIILNTCTCQVISIFKYLRIYILYILYIHLYILYYTYLTLNFLHNMHNITHTYTHMNLMLHCLKRG